VSDLLRDNQVLWAAALVIVLPLLVVAANELDERLRQRESHLRPALITIRTWTFPLFAIWMLLVALFEVDPDRFVVRLVATGLVLSLASAGLSVVRILVRRHRDRPRLEGEFQLPQILLLLPRLAIALVAGWVIATNIWSIDLSSAAAALGVGSLVVSFALQDTLSGLASGLLLLGDQPFRPGEWIRADDVEGLVVDVNWRSTRIQTRDGDLKVVPNASLAGATITNFDQPTSLHRVVVPVQVAYVNPPTLAKEMLLDAARATEGVLADPPPVIRVVGIDDPLMSYEAHLWVDDYEIAPRVSSDFGSLVWYQSHRHDVPLPSPAYDLYVYDGERANEAARPDRVELRRRLRVSPLLRDLGEDDVDRLAVTAQAHRFAQGETVWTAGAGDRDLFVLHDGRARMVVDGDGGAPIPIVELDVGDVFGLVIPPHGSAPARVTAVTDCDLVIVPADSAGAVASRNPTLAASLDRLGAVRSRRLQRLVARDGQTPALGAGDGSA
jgi:small-conductance mechanosensitive channel